MTLSTTRCIATLFICLVPLHRIPLLRPLQSAAAPRRIEVTAKRFEYVPAELSLKVGEPIVIVLRSQDVTHGLKFADLHLQATIEKGGTSELRFTPDHPGNFIGHCSHFCGSGHGAMILTLHVTP